MRFKHQRQGSQVPEVNLVPMMDVLMSVLTFFIIISMTLTGQQWLNVRLPRSVSGASDAGGGAVTVVPLVVGLDQAGNLVMDNTIITFEQLNQRTRAYFAQYPDGQLILKADRELAYQDVATLLTDLRATGGNRVSLAVE
jgi:biopolymer transport protein ExbD